MTDRYRLTGEEVARLIAEAVKAGLADSEIEASRSILLKAEKALQKEVPIGPEVLWRRVDT